MILYFKNSHGIMREIAKLDDYCTDGEILTAAFAEIDAFCKERNFKTYYTRIWNEERDGKMMTKFDVGSHTEFFYLDPSVDIDRVRDPLEG